MLVRTLDTPSLVTYLRKAGGPYGREYKKIPRFLWWMEVNQSDGEERGHKLMKGNKAVAVTYDEWQTRSATCARATRSGRGVICSR